MVSLLIRDTLNGGFTYLNFDLFHILIAVHVLSSLLSLLFPYRTRYFSAPRKGHNPLQGRAYYQLLECLGVFALYDST